MDEDGEIKRLLHEVVRENKTTRNVLENIGHRLQKIEERDSGAAQVTVLLATSTKPKGEFGRPGGGDKKPGYNLFKAMEVDRDMYLNIREFVRKQCHRHDLGVTVMSGQRMMKLAAICQLTLDEFKLPTDKEWSIRCIIQGYLRAQRADAPRKAKRADHPKKRRALLCNNCESAIPSDALEVLGVFGDIEMRNTSDEPVDDASINYTVQDHEDLPLTLTDIAKPVPKPVTTSPDVKTTTGFIDCFSSSPSADVKKGPSLISFTRACPTRPPNSRPFYMDLEGWFYSGDGSILEVEYDEETDQFSLLEYGQNLVVDLMPQNFTGNGKDFSDGFFRGRDEFGRWDVGYTVSRRPIVSMEPIMSPFSADSLTPEPDNGNHEDTVNQIAASISNGITVLGLKSQDTEPIQIARKSKANKGKGRPRAKPKSKIETIPVQPPKKSKSNVNTQKNAKTKIKTKAVPEVTVPTRKSQRTSKPNVPLD